VIDVVHQINAVARRVGSRTLPAGEARTVVVTRSYAAPIEDVWDACTNPERIPRWFLPISGELRVGGRFQLEGQAGGTIERCDPPRGFAATWEFGGEVTWIELQLTPDGSGETQLQLEHIAHVDDERWAQFGPGAVGVGWDLGLIGLSLHFQSGGAQVDPAEVAAWTVSAEGKQFIRDSSEGWGEASIAAGTPADAARAAAARTTAFYTGEEAPA
jgi:uncharacterized protein YndB with AHSA1/START domain